MRTSHGAAPAAAIDHCLPNAAAIERTVTLAEYSEARPTALRLSQISNKKNGQWKLILRHADPLVAKTATEMIETR